MRSAIYNRTLRTMRVACPLMIVACVIVGTLAWRRQLYAVLATDAFLAGINIVLTWVEWRVLSPMEE